MPLEVQSRGWTVNWNRPRMFIGRWADSSDQDCTERVPRTPPKVVRMGFVVKTLQTNGRKDFPKCMAGLVSHLAWDNMVRVSSDRANPRLFSYSTKSVLGCNGLKWNWAYRTALKKGTIKTRRLLDCRVQKNGSSQKFTLWIKNSNLTSALEDDRDPASYKSVPALTSASSWFNWTFKETEQFCRCWPTGSELIVLSAGGYTGVPQW